MSWEIFGKKKNAFGTYRHVITKLSFFLFFFVFFFFHFLLVFNGVMTLHLHGCLETLQKETLPFLSKLLSDKLSLSSFILVIYISRLFFTVQESSMMTLTQEALNSLIFSSISLEIGMSWFYVLGLGKKKLKV